MTAAGESNLASRGAVSAFLAPKRRTRLSLLLLPPMAWLVIAYLGAIFALLLSAFWSIDFSGNVVHSYDTANLHNVFTQSLYRDVAVRSLVIALGVTVVDVVIALPMAFYMSMVASPRVRRLLVVAVLTPLWASYLVKAYAWNTLLSPSGPLSYVVGSHNPGYGETGVVLTLAYLLLPYMVIPVYAGFERIPRSLVEASADLGAGAGRTTRSVLLPLVLPAIAAGSIFTFSLSIGDYIAVGLVGGKTQVLATLIKDQIILNPPLSAAIAIIPLTAIVLYLFAMRRTGALDNV